ncbi:GNAT family N-acetyltransferase [soil metagenome]
MLDFQWYKFSQLTTNQLYAILALRTEVFIVEQKCAYADADGRDYDALHLLGIEDHALVTYLRVFPPTEKANIIVFGRVLTAQVARNKGYAKQLLQALLDYCDIHFPNIVIKCSAQCYLQKFYESFGFVAEGEPYEEDGIPHIAMKKPLRTLPIWQT